jgi:hypothetical protein
VRGQQRRFLLAAHREIVATSQQVVAGNTLVDKTVDHISDMPPSSIVDQDVISRDSYFYF